MLILDGGQAVFDSTVISGTLEYMMPTVPLLPADPHARAQVRTMEALGAGMSEAAVAMLLERRFHAEEGKISQQWLMRQERKIDNALDWLTQHFQANPGFYLTKHFSLADISVGCALFYIDFRFSELGWRKRYPLVAEYADRLAHRPSFENTKPQ
ncbi:MAG: glutathione S-transferase [Limnobacter sp.]|nr:glutathione S-transferase [Limnobacter sp.]